MSLRQDSPQRRLLRLATWAQVMAWGVFVVSLVWAWLGWETFKHAVALRHLGMALSWGALLREEPWPTLDALVGMLYRLLLGALWALILQSVATGLRILAALAEPRTLTQGEEP